MHDKNKTNPDEDTSSIAGDKKMSDEELDITASSSAIAGGKKTKKRKSSKKPSEAQLNMNADIQSAAIAGGKRRTKKRKGKKHRCTCKICGKKMK